MSIRDTHSFDQRLILRSPIYSLTEFDKNFIVEDLIKDPVFLEAIYLASPSLYNACIKYRNGLILVEREIVKFKYSLYKYYSRMHNRCTPFGLFSSCRLTNWKEGASEVIVDQRNLSRHTRLDMHYLCALAEYLSIFPAVRNNLLYFPNSSWYVLGDDIRYIEYQYVNGKREHQISAIKSSVYLFKIIEAAKHGVTRANLVQVLEESGIENEQATEFVDNCLISQLFVHELDPAVTGNGLLDQIFNVLEKYSKQNIEISLIIQKLKQVEQLLIDLDQIGNNEINKYQEILTLIDTLNVPYEIGKIFQTDVTGGTNPKSGLSVELQEQILDTLDVLNKISIKKTLYLESFSKQFDERYGDREMPLLEVLDAETGIGYGPNEHLVPSPILDGLTLPETNDSQLFLWGKWERLLQKKWLKAYKNDELQIEIDEEDMQDIIPVKRAFPSSLQFMFYITSSGQILVKSIGGASAVNLISRFAQSDTEIEKLTSDLTKIEENNTSGTLLAEVVHLPEGRIGNILQRPILRKYEIPYLAKSLLPQDQQIHVQDLSISIRNKKIVLYSKKLNKIITPRLSNAHNFHHNGLPVYRFLCDLQDQDQIGNLNFSWGSLQHQYSFFPRVVYKNVILQRAIWVFRDKDIQNLLQKSYVIFKELLLEFAKEYNLPQKVFLVEGDNELLIDLSDYQKTHDIFELSLKNKPRFVFKEYLEAAHVVRNEKGEHYMHQFQTFITVKNEVNMKLLKQDDVSCMQQEGVMDTCDTDSEWLYYKLYCGIRNAEILLANPVRAITDHCEKRGWIKEWFFIRYIDTDFHIRLRLKLTDIKWLPYIKRLFHAASQPYRKTGFIWKVMTDTYRPEYIRYGINTISFAEKLFYYDSKAFLGFLDHTSGDERETLRWQYAILSIDTLLEAFEFKLAGKLELIKELKDAFAMEFNFNAEQRKQLAKLFRKHKSEIYTSLVLQHPEDRFYQLYLILRDRTNQIDTLIRQLLKMDADGILQVPIVKLIGSYIHMLINRIIPELPRLHETVIYDFLYQYYKGIQEKENKILKKR